MTVIDMVKKALEESGYDGLYNDDLGCACLNDDLRPCDSDFSQCKPGYKHDTPNDPDHDWIISEVGRMKQEIEAEGLPEGWEVESVNVSGINFNNERTSMKVPVIAHIQKIQPRRIVLEETEEIRKAKPDEYYEHTGGLAINKSHRETSGEYKIWKEVKE